MTARARIGLIDYGSGNLRSVAKALEAVGAAPEQIVQGPIPAGLDALVLPGVGSFGDSVRHLQERGLFRPIRDWLTSQKKFLGICLGYQLLFQASEESPGVEGLGLFEGTVQKIQGGRSQSAPNRLESAHLDKASERSVPGITERSLRLFCSFLLSCS